MSTPVEATSAPAESRPAVSDEVVRPPRPGRWHLNRAGILNIWQYREQTFDLSGGRGIFQGTNGSGKSRTLELLLPLCLDGELRQLGAKGFDTVSIRKLMLDDYDGGPNRIGYAWVELRRTATDDGSDPAEEFLTCGIGVKASATSQQISDSWRFVTTDRIGVDMSLAGPDRVPLGPAALREVLGEDCVLDDVTFRARVAELVYGLPVGRYPDLLHLQRTLRNPDVGLKVQEGQLEQILSDALPPLDPEQIDRLATSFEDLESFRENISRLTVADNALSEFLGHYSDYAHSALKTIGSRVVASEKSLGETRQQQLELTKSASGARKQRAEAERHILELEGQGEELGLRIEALKELPAYAGLEELADRKRAVEGAKTAAANALDSARRARLAEDRSVASAGSVLRQLAGARDTAVDHAEQLREHLATAGLEVGRCPSVPAIPGGEPTKTVESVRGAPEADAPPLEVERLAPPQVDPEDLRTALKQSVEDGERIRQEAAERVALTNNLHHQASDVDRQRAEVERLLSEARQAQLGATDHAGRRDQAHQQVSSAADQWVEAVRRWSQSELFVPLLSTGTLPPTAPSVDVLRSERTATRTAREAATSWAAPRLHDLHGRVAAANHETGQLDAAIAETETELTSLRAGQQTEPSASSLRSHDRDKGTGAPFYRLVDFATSLTDAERAGLEAALTSCGLLDAWVRSDGAVLAPDLTDILATTAGGANSTKRTLADVLMPAAGRESPVPASQVGQLLAQVTVSDFKDLDTEIPADHGLVVSLTGHWAAGVLRGVWTKSNSEFIGAGAREAARVRRIEELTERLSELRVRRETATAEASTAADELSSWERHLAAYPADDALITSYTRLDAANERASETASNAKHLRGRHEAADQRAKASITALTQAATEAGLTPEGPAIEAAQRAATAARQSAKAIVDTLAGRALPLVDELVEQIGYYETATADREQAEAAALTAADGYAAQAATLTELTESIGGEAVEIENQLSRLEADRKATQSALPASRKKLTSLAEQIARTETKLEAKTSELTAREHQATESQEEFRAALGAPGVWAAAIGYLDEEAATDGTSRNPAPTDLTVALEALDRRGRRKGTTTTSEEAVITRLQTLQTALAGTHTVTPQRHAGILTFIVAGEDGPRPAAESARNVREKLDRDRAHLNEQYQEIFAAYLLRDLADGLANQLSVAEDLCTRMNQVLDGARSSQGVHVQLDWQPSASLDDRTREAIGLIRTAYRNRSDEQDEKLRSALTDRIESIRDSTPGTYAEILTQALDYRQWFGFTVKVRDLDSTGKPRLRRVRQLSSGETRLISYVTLFAAAAAFYDAIDELPARPASTTAAGVSRQPSPLRLVLLDEAFERLDDPTIARMLGLLVDLDMDWLITWPSGWGVSEKIPRMHIYDVLRPRNGRGVACTHTTWDGAVLADDQS